MLKLVVTFALFVTLALSAPHEKPWIGSSVHPFQDYFNAHHKEYLARTQDKSLHIKGIFLGDSITEGWNGNGREYFQEHFVPKGIFNYGIGADKTQNVLWRIENGEFDGLKELKAVFLMIGTNNLSVGDEPLDVFKGVEAIVKALQAKGVPKILLISVLPRTGAPLDTKVHLLNAKISTLADHKAVHWIDLTDKFETAVGQQITNQFIGDLLHLSRAGYDTWGARIAPEVEELMK